MLVVACELNHPTIATRLIVRVGKADALLAAMLHNAPDASMPTARTIYGEAIAHWSI